MPRILQMFKRKRRKGRLRRALGLPEKNAGKAVIPFPQVTPEIHEEYPDYEVISRWLKLADEMLESADIPRRDEHFGGSSRKRA